MSERLLTRPTTNHTALTEITGHTDPPIYTDTPTHRPTQIPPEFAGIMSYNPWHDIQDFLNLRRLNGQIPPQEYAALQTQTINRKRRDLEKTIGERFAVEKSETTYFIENGRLMSPDYARPVIDQYKTGQQALKEMGSVEIDREQAEIEGLEEVEKLFKEGEIKEAETLVVISAQGPDGSLYEENFFDLYQPKNGQIIMTRYHSTHSYQQFLEAARQLDPTFESPDKEQLDATYFLKRPIKTTLETEKVLEIMALDTETQAESINREIVEACMPFINHRIHVLLEDPDNIEANKLSLNAIYNKADETDRKIKMRSRQKVFTKNLEEYRHAWEFAYPQSLKAQVDYWGRQPVKTVNRGCPGGQRGFSVSQPSTLRSLATAMSTRSVVDFSPFAKSDEDEDTSDFACGGTREDGSACTYTVKYGSGIRKCPECGNEAKCT